MVGRGLTRPGMTPLLKSAVAVDTPRDVRTELAAVVAEQYSTVERLRRVLPVIEACAADLPPLEALYFGRRRRGRIDLLRDYLQRRAASGYLRSLPDMAVAERIVPRPPRHRVAAHGGRRDRPDEARARQCRRR
jgi:hypothetical protein